MEPWSCKVISRTEEAAFEIRQREVNGGGAWQVRLGEGPDFAASKAAGGNAWSLLCKCNQHTRDDNSQCCSRVHTKKVLANTATRLSCEEIVQSTVKVCPVDSAAAVVSDTLIM